ncbi:hypothetical protein ABIE44_003107 [Marmoricola sp. OAE513]|uniref:hypothetical protein n=1 Tax=Marmoricola sp. OAE513 TaxID=2817894 RepID=UPI001AE86D08
MFKKLKARATGGTSFTDPAPLAAPARAATRRRPYVAPLLKIRSDLKPATVEVADFAALDEAGAVDLLQRARDAAAAGRAACAHLVVTCDLRTGLVNHHVPCSSGVEALELAAQVVADRRATQPHRPFTVTVTPLLPHLP